MGMYNDKNYTSAIGMSIQREVDIINYCISKPSQYKVIVDDTVLRYYDVIKPCVSPNPNEERWEVPYMGCLKPHEMSYFIDNYLLIIPLNGKFAWWELEIHNE